MTEPDSEYVFKIGKSGRFHTDIFRVKPPIEMDLLKMFFFSFL